MNISLVPMRELENIIYAKTEAETRINFASDQLIVFTKIQLVPS